MVRLASHISKPETNIMDLSRRGFLKGSAAATAGLVTAPLATEILNGQKLEAAGHGIAAMFDHLPGDKALKIVVPLRSGKSKVLAELNAEKRLFVASANKTFILCEALRQADSPDIDAELEAKALVLDSSVWSFGSFTFNPPNLRGIVSERTTLEAMITRSDNTATDMILKLAGADNVRRFIATAGLNNTLIPDSTRALTGYVFGGPIPGLDTRSRILPGAWATLERDLARHPPTYIIDVQSDPNTAQYPVKDFPILAKLLAKRYLPVAHTAEGVIYRMR